MGGYIVQIIWQRGSWGYCPRLAVGWSSAIFPSGLDQKCKLQSFSTTQYIQGLQRPLQVIWRASQGLAWSSYGKQPRFQYIFNPFSTNSPQTIQPSVEPNQKQEEILCTSCGFPPICAVSKMNVNQLAQLSNLLQWFVVSDLQNKIEKLTNMFSKP